MFLDTCAISSTNYGQRGHSTVRPCVICPDEIVRVESITCRPRRLHRFRQQSRPWRHCEASLGTSGMISSEKRAAKVVMMFFIDVRVASGISVVLLLVKGGG